MSSRKHDPDALGRSMTGPEHRKVRLPTVEKLLKLGWDEGQLRWQPEWRVPQSPSEASKRESGTGFQGWPTDLAIFDDPSHAGDWEHVVILCEFKAPDLESGLAQLEIYLNREPRARMGFWTNGAEDVRVYRLADGTFKSFRNRGLPRPGDTYERPGERPLTYKDLHTPDLSGLSKIFKRLLDVVVARDSVSTRGEAQLNEICNLLLLKLESDTIGESEPDKPLQFQLAADEATTARSIRAFFKALHKQRPQIFSADRDDEIRLDDHSIHQAVYELAALDLLTMKPEAISHAFQVFRSRNLKAGEGQYFTPERVISAAIKLLDIHSSDKVIDPACGTGGFLTAAFLEILARSVGSRGEANARTWAHRNIFGVDRDEINVKLARAILMSMGDGSVNVHVGDSIREDRWVKDYPHLPAPLAPGSFTVVVTNPPFGKNLKVSKVDAERNRYTIAQKGRGSNAAYADLEIGLVFLERAWRLLQEGGRLGIVLPETYFFSSSYRWLAGWIDERFILRGVVNIPMEAFQGFCRAKTNFYVFEKKVATNGA